MPPQQVDSEFRKRLDKFRLATARSILRYATNTNLIHSDIDSNAHIIELCDDYCLRILASYLATKSGFPAYVPSIRSPAHGWLRTLESWEFLSAEYPFNTGLSSDLLNAAGEAASESLAAIGEPHLHLLGTLYEQIVGAPLKIAGADRIYIEKSDKRRTKGQFYTPPWVVSYSLSRSLSDSSSAVISQIKAASMLPVDSGNFAKSIYKVIDPACGTGNYLLGTVAWLADNGLPEDALTAFVSHGIYGIEVDPRAAALCRLALLVSLARPLSALASREGVDALSMRLSSCFASLKSHITVSDSLYGQPKGEFDLVLGNPPYISFGSRNQPTPPAGFQRFLKSQYPQASQYKIRLHSIFQDIALGHARQGGRISLLVPDAFLTGSFYGRLRERILARARILSLSELPADTIDGPTVGRWCVACYERQDMPEGPYPVDLYGIGQAGLKEIHFRIPSDLLVSRSGQRFRMIFSQADADIMRRLDALPQLSSLVRGHTGIRCRLGQKTIVASEALGPSWKRGIGTGARLLAQRIEWDNTYLNVAPDMLYAGGFDPLIIESPKLLVRQTGDRIIAALDQSGLYHLNNVHSFSPAYADNGRTADLRYLEGLLNSRFWLYLYRQRTREAGRPLAQIDIETVEGMPHPCADSMEAAAIARLSYAVAQNHRDVSVLRRSIDRLVYDLYGLSDAEVLHVEATCLDSRMESEPLPDRAAALALAESLDLEVAARSRSGSQEALS